MTPREHITELCAQLGVIWDELAAELWQYSRATSRGVIAAPSPIHEVAYLVCLHELGHVALGHTQSTKENRAKARDPLLRLFAEMDAWVWALNEYTEQGGELTGEGKQAIERSVNTYLQDLSVKYQAFDTLFRTLPDSPCF